MFELRLAEPSDIPALDVLIPAAARSLSAGFYSEPQIESAIRYIFGPDTQLIQDRTFYVATVGSAIIGCGGWSQRRTLFGGDQAKSSSDPRLDPRVDPARIRAFFVDSRWARRGVGRAILDACSNAARHAGFRALELVATLPGEPLYRAGGFQALERFELQLPDGVELPVVRMARSLETD
jgi:GNAT superfamily N-acetyltransferase